MTVITIIIINITFTFSFNLFDDSLQVFYDGVSSVQFSSVAQSCPTLCDPMSRSTPGLPVHHQLPEFTQTRVHRVSDAIQPSHPRSSVSGNNSGFGLQYSCLENPMDGGAWKAAVHGVSKSRTWLNYFTFTFHVHALEKEMATHSSVLAWRIPGTGEPGGLPAMGVTQVWTRLKWLSSSR